MATQAVVIDSAPKKALLNVYRVVYITGRKETRVFPGPVKADAPDEAKPIEQWVNTGIHKTVNVLAASGELATSTAADSDKTFGQIVSVTQVCADVLVKA